MVRWEDARVDEEKILGYLLATAHPVGADKARFFASVGYHRDHWERLRADPLSLGRIGASGQEVRTSFGIKYVADGLVQTPDGHTIELRTIWISDDPTIHQGL